MTLLCINNEKNRVTAYQFGYIAGKSRVAALQKAQEMSKETKAKFVRFDPLPGGEVGALMMMKGTLTDEQRQELNI